MRSCNLSRCSETFGESRKRYLGHFVRDVWGNGLLLKHLRFDAYSLPWSSRQIGPLLENLNFVNNLCRYADPNRYYLLVLVPAAVAVLVMMVVVVSVVVVTVGVALLRQLPV